MSVPSVVLPTATWTISMEARRVLGDAAVLYSGVCAGTIESRNGSDNDAPMPRSIVRRDRCFLVMNIVLGLLEAAPWRSRLGLGAVVGFGAVGIGAVGRGD